MAMRNLLIEGCIMKKKSLLVPLIFSLLMGVSGIIIMSCVFTSSQPPDPLTNVRAKISIGTNRDQALELLSDAQRHIECWYPSNRVDDLFFYGSSNMDEAYVVIIGSEVISGQLRVWNIGSYEKYALHAQYDDCINRDDLSTQMP